MVVLGELDELVLAHIVTKPKPLLAHARADLDMIVEFEFTTGISRDTTIIKHTYSLLIPCIPAFARPSQ